MASIIPNQTALAKSIVSADTIIPLVSMANINKGDVLYMDMEAMPTSKTLSPNFTSTPPTVVVARSGRASSHAAGVTVYTGPPSAFVVVDPTGVPAPGSQPWQINTLNGRIWVAQGDEGGPGVGNRFWLLQSTIPGIGALGVRTSLTSPQ
jgi:hypothetical protein